MSARLLSWPRAGRREWLASMGVALACLTPISSIAQTPDQIAGAATDAVRAIAGGLVPYVGAIAAAGVLAMATVEFLKAALSLQLVFQRVSLFLWLGMPWRCAFGWNKTHGEVLPELLYLSIGERKHLNVLCGQDLPKMMGQIQAAARIALDYPDKFPRLYHFLTKTDLVLTGTATNDPERLGRHAQAVHNEADVSGPRQVPAPTAAPAQEGGAGPSAVLSAPTAAQTQARVANLVSRKLDGFQLRTSFWWARFCQLLAMAMSIAICWQALSIAAPTLSPWWLFGLGFVGGLLAPFVKDFSQSLANFASGK